MGSVLELSHFISRNSEPMGDILCHKACQGCRPPFIPVGVLIRHIQIWGLIIFVIVHSDDMHYFVVIGEHYCGRGEASPIIKGELKSTKIANEALVFLKEVGIIGWLKLGTWDGVESPWTHPWMTLEGSWISFKHSHWRGSGSLSLWRGHGAGSCPPYLKKHARQQKTVNNG